jgi:hypothetical protein
VVIFSGYVKAWFIELLTSGLWLFLTSPGNVQVGVSVLAACWRQYSSLILLEDRILVSNPDPVVEHWCGALQVTIQTEGVTLETNNFWLWRLWP